MSLIKQNLREAEDMPNPDYPTKRARHIMTDGACLKEFCRKNDISYHMVIMRLKRGVPLKYCLTMTAKQYCLKQRTEVAF